VREEKVKLIAASMGDVPIAVNNVNSYMNPKARTQLLHSTTFIGLITQGGSLNG
jgi:thioredoxin reductase (NADPH)